MTETSAASPAMSDLSVRGAHQQVGPARRERPTRRLPPALRKGLLSAHIVAGVGWIGVDVVLLGAGTRWGIIRYWWLTVKLVITVVLTTLVSLLLRPRVAEVASRAEQAGAAGLSRDQLGNIPVDIVFPPSVSIAALLFATVLAVYKPWGRTPFARPGEPSMVSAPRPAPAPPPSMGELRVEPTGQTEDREQVGVEEVVMSDDAVP